MTRFEAAAKALARLTPERLLLEIERDAAVADRKDALKRIANLERVIRQLRERLEQVPEPALEFSEAECLIEKNADGLASTGMIETIQRLGDYGFTQVNDAAALTSPVPLYRGHFG